jgi:hypothetical protein
MSVGSASVCATAQAAARRGRVVAEVLKHVCGQRYQQLPLTQAAAESGNSVITSTVVAAPTIKAKPKAIRTKACSWS